MYWREIDLFLVDTGYAKYLKQRETRKFHAFFVLVWKQELINQIKQVITIKNLWK